MTDKATDKRASTLIKLGLADDQQAQLEASLLAEEVSNKDEITSSSYLVQILGTDLAANKAGKSFTVRSSFWTRYQFPPFFGGNPFTILLPYVLFN